MAMLSIIMFRENGMDILNEYPLQSIDTGGVCRDMFSVFWSDVYLRHCDGEQMFVHVHRLSVANGQAIGDGLYLQHLRCEQATVVQHCKSDACFVPLGDTRHYSHDYIASSTEGSTIVCRGVRTCAYNMHACFLPYSGTFSLGLESPKTKIRPRKVERHCCQ